MKLSYLLGFFLIFSAMSSMQGASHKSEINVSNFDKFKAFIRSLVFDLPQEDHKDIIVLPLNRLLKLDFVILDALMKAFFESAHSQEIINKIKISGDKELLGYISKYFEVYKNRYGNRKDGIPMVFLWQWYGFKNLNAGGHKRFWLSFEVDYSPIEILEISYDNNFIVTGDRNGDVMVRDSDTRKLLYKLTDPNGSVNSIAISKDNSFMATVSANGKVIVWNFNTGQELYRLNLNNDIVTSLDISSDNNYIITALNDKKIQIWSALEGNLIKTFHDGSTQNNSYIDTIKIIDNSLIIAKFCIPSNNLCIIKILDFNNGDILGKLTFTGVVFGNVNEFNDINAGYVTINDDGSIAFFSKGRMKLYDVHKILKAKKPEAFLNSTLSVNLKSSRPILSHDYSFVIENFPERLENNTNNRALAKIRSVVSNRVISLLPQPRGLSFVIKISHDDKFIVMGTKMGSLFVCRLDTI